MATVFFAWSGPVSQEVAEHLSWFLDNMLDDFRSWISTKDIGLGDVWRSSLQEALKEATFCIPCLTMENFRAPWLAFEAGASWKALAEQNLVCPFVFDRPVGLIEQPLSGFQACTAERAAILRLAERVAQGSSGARRVRERFQRFWPELEAAFLRIREANDYKHGYISALRTLDDRSREVLRAAPDPTLLSLCRAMLEDVERTVSQITHREKRFEVAYVKYPYYHLTMLEEHPDPIVKAIALVGQDEHFWNSSVGEQIRARAGAESTRVFVFSDSEHLKQHASVIATHARAYSVFVMSRQLLRTSFPDFEHDFSVVKWEDGSCLAKYVEVNSEKRISFTTDEADIKTHLKAFNNIVARSCPVSKNFDASSAEDIETLSDAVFSSLTRYNRMEVEMSRYICIDEYDEHEEDHAYYVEMMAEMIEAHRRHHGAATARRRILEFGAGTGIFTSRIAQMGHSDIVAVELDIACFKRLESKARRITAGAGDVALTPIRADSRIYDPEGQFDTIFSSFADHHIPPNDKPIYFNNVKRNLGPGGCFIVGDEFLPDYDPDDDASYDRALDLYHGHIIELAEAAGHSEVAALERAALDSGLKRQGDFKMSCAIYEEHLRRAGFRYAKRKIGPDERSDVGGVFVYVIQSQ